MRRAYIATSRLLDDASRFAREDADHRPAGGKTRLHFRWDRLRKHVLIPQRDQEPSCGFEDFRHVLRCTPRQQHYAIGQSASADFVFEPLTCPTIADEHP